MARTANTADTADENKVVIHRLTCDISVAFDTHVDDWCHKQDITRASAIRSFCAEGFEYAGETGEIVLVKRSTAAIEAGRKRKESFAGTKQAANELAQLKAKLASGELSAEQLVALLLG